MLVPHGSCPSSGPEGDFVSFEKDWRNNSLVKAFMNQKPGASKGNIVALLFDEDELISTGHNIIYSSCSLDPKFTK